jgi:hypothetical protein
MTNRKIIPTLMLFHSLTILTAQTHELRDKQNSALYATPVTMGITSSQMGFPIISIAFEHSLTDRGLALFIPLHAGYLEDRNAKQYAAGLGLGFRKYIGESFSGSYLTAQSDYVRGEDIRDGGYWEYPQYDPNNPYYRPGVWVSGARIRNGISLSISQLSYGYKWMWKQVVLDLSLGGAFYANQDEKFTGFIGAANIGIPFSKSTFGF